MAFLESRYPCPDMSASDCCLTAMPSSMVHYNEFEPQPCAADIDAAMARDLSVVCGSPFLTNIVYDISAILEESRCMWIVERAIARGNIGTCVLPKTK